MNVDVVNVKLRIIAAGHKAVNELIKVAEEQIIVDGDDELAADKLKNAAMSKKLAIFDAFEILSRIEAEKEILNTPDNDTSKTKTKKGFAERHAT